MLVTSWSQMATLSQGITSAFKIGKRKVVLVPAVLHPFIRRQKIYQKPAPYQQTFSNISLVRCWSHGYLLLQEKLEK